MTVTHTFDLAQQMATVPHLAIMFSMSWFGIPSSAGGPDTVWGNWKWAPPMPNNCGLTTNDPTTCGADSQRNIASKRRPLAGIYSVSGKNAESLRRTDLFLSNLRRSCDDGAKLDAWAVQLSSLVLTSLHTATPEANAELNYQALLHFFSEAEANGMSNVMIPAQDVTWYWHNSPANATIANVQQDAIDMVNLSLQHTSALKINGKPVILYYVDSTSGSDGPTPAQWATIFANARNTTGSDFYTIATAQGSNTGWFSAFDAIAPWISLGAWSSATGATTHDKAVNYAGAITNSIVSAAAAQQGRVAFGGVSPGFDDYTHDWGACVTRLIPRDTEFVRGQFDYLKTNGFKGVVMETWDDWTEGSEWEPDTGSGTSFIVSLRDNLANLYGEVADAAGDQRLANRWSGYGQAEACPGVAVGTSPATLSCGTGGTTGTIQGVVSNVQTGAAISGATVSWSGGSAVSDAAGNYTLANVTAGSVTITGSATGYLARNYTVTVTAGSTTAQNVQLSTSGKIVGNVTGNGAALSGATVAISGGQIATSQSVQTDATGHYDEGWVPIGSYTVTCSASGFGSQSQTATVATGATTTVNCALSSTGSISGVVTNLGNGQALSGATLTAAGASTTSAADGSYTLANLPAGSTTLTATATGYLARSYTVTVTGGATVTQNVQLSTSGKIAGNVTGNGSALSGATVAISGGQIATNQSVQTDATGHYDEGWVPIGSYTVTCSASGFASQTQTVSVTSGVTTTANCALCNEQPVITEPFDNESVGQAINLHVSAGSCVTQMNVYIDDVLVQTISGNVSPVPPSTTNWIGGYTEGVTHRLVVVGFANDPGTASTTIHFLWP
ncbi:MAG TPA: carboxypeptidase regulatory-like domain-containing protein [Myxococcales bacterium]